MEPAAGPLSRKASAKLGVSRESTKFSGDFFRDFFRKFPNGDGRGRGWHWKTAGWERSRARGNHGPESGGTGAGARRSPEGGAERRESGTPLPPVGHRTQPRGRVVFLTGRGLFFKLGCFSSNWEFFQGGMVVSTNRDVFFDGSEVCRKFQRALLFFLFQEGGEPLEPIGYVVLNAHTYFTRILRCATANFNTSTRLRMRAYIRAYALL